MTDVVGIVLAAGSSQRLGRPKQTLSFGSRTLLGHVVADVEATSSLNRVVVVVGESPRFESLPGRAELVVAATAAAGCSTSIQAGLAAAGECRAVVLVLGDMPGVTARIIDAVVDGWRTSPTWAAVTSYDTGIGHPMLFSNDAFPALRSLHGDKAVWKIVDREPEARVRRVRVAGPLPRDIDTWDDYETVCHSFGFAPEGALG